MINEFVFPIRVYYEDTDMVGIVYHANYIKYMDRARCAWLGSMGFDLLQAQQEGMFFVVHSLQIKYLKSARFCDSLEVVSRVKECNKVSVVFEQDIRSAVDSKLFFSIGQVTVAWVNEKQRPCKLPDYLFAEIKK